MKKILITAMVLTLGACASQPPQTLDQKLTGKTGEDRKEILRLACLNEAEWPIYNSSYYQRANGKIKQSLKYRYNSEVSEMKALCRQMDDLTTADAEKKLSPKDLSGICEARVVVKKEKDRKGGAEHAARIQHICEEMTGQKITIGSKL